MLLCKAIGNPEPTIKWKRNGLPLGGKHQDTSILYKMQDESSKYICAKGFGYFFSNLDQIEMFLPNNP